MSPDLVRAFLAARRHADSIGRRLVPRLAEYLAGAEQLWALDRYVAIGVTSDVPPASAVAAALVVVAAARAAAQTPAAAGADRRRSTISRRSSTPRARAELDERIRALQATTGDVARRRHRARRTRRSDRSRSTPSGCSRRPASATRRQDNGVLIVARRRGSRASASRSATGSKSSSPTASRARRFARTCCRAFREGRYGEGLLDGTTRLIQRIAEKRGVTLAGRAAAAAARRRAAPSGLGHRHDPRRRRDRRS